MGRVREGWSGTPWAYREQTSSVRLAGFSVARCAAQTDLTRQESGLAGSPRCPLRWAPPGLPQVRFAGGDRTAGKRATVGVDAGFRQPRQSEPVEGPGGGAADMPVPAQGSMTCVATAGSRAGAAAIVRRRQSAPRSRQPHCRAAPCGVDVRLRHARGCGGCFGGPSRAGVNAPPGNGFPVALDARQGAVLSLLGMPSADRAWGGRPTADGAADRVRCGSAEGCSAGRA